MNTLCEVCNKEKEYCFICNGRSSSCCVEHSSTMTMFEHKPICITCLSLYKCKINIADNDINENNIITEPIYETIDEPVINNCERFTLYLKSILYLFWVIKPVYNEPVKFEPLVIECNNIKKSCPICRKKETINCSIHNPNVKNTCDNCVKLLICDKCNQAKETTWSHKCGKFCTDCVQKIEIDIGSKILCKLFGDIEGDRFFSKWVIYCEKCIQGSVLDIQKREYELLKKVL